MGNFILDSIVRRRFSKMSSSILKNIIASAVLFGSWINAQSQIITADILSACPGQAVEFTQTGFNSAAIEWERYDGTKWVKEDQIKATSHFVIDMGNSEMKIRAKAGAQVSNEITITRSTECKNSCMVSSSGDYITGTDFDRKNPSESKPAVPDGVESYFSDYNVGFSNNNSSYFVTTDLGSTFNGQYPILDNGKKDNSYYVFSDNFGDQSPFTYQYPCKNFHGQNYRLAMRMYVMKKAGCNGPSAKIKLETRHGNQTLDRAVMKIYDNDNQLIRQDQVLQTYGSVDLNIDNKYAGKLLRIDFTFYGYFPEDKYDDRAGTYNGLVYYTMIPKFQQFDGCYTVAIDYLSAEVENVCLSPQMVCAGTSATTIAYATGFDSEASYKWEIQEANGKWVSVGMGAFDGTGDAYRKATIPVTRTGKINGRCIVKSKGFLASGEVQNIERTVEFTVTGKDCDPIYPEKISGPDLICAPETEKGLYELSPVDDDENIFYRWTLKTPTGRIINNTVYQGEGEGMQSVNVKGSKIRLIMPALSEHGTYTLTAQTYERFTYDGVTTDMPKGQPLTRTIVVHNTPVPRLTLSGDFGTSAEQDKTLCPADTKTEITANVTISNVDAGDKYVYTWTGATSAKKSNTSAIVSWNRAAACDGTAKNHTVSVTAEIDGIGCPATVFQKYAFEKPVDPTIDCSKINNSEYILGEKESKKTIELPLPSYTASCDPDPKMTIDIVVKDLDGNKLTGTNQSRTVSFSMSQASTINKKVEAPAGTIELKYSITDGCGKTESCNAVIKVKDVTAPNINCDLIKNYTAYLKNQADCNAVPGYYPTELPKITAPALKDLNGVDGTLIGKYLGRREGESRPTAVPQLFSTKEDLNDAYKKGVTWILWEFADKSDNKSYCLQKITVIDDKKPEVTCPNVELGTLDVDTLTCTLKPSSVIAKIKETSKLPYGFDKCSKTPEDSLVPTLYYRIPKEGDELHEIKDSQLDDPIFETKIKYELVWVFKKIAGAYVDENVSVECAIPFMVEDQDAPEFDCSSLINIMVYPNYTMTTTEVKYDGFASGMGKKVNETGKTYTLQKYFEDGYLSMHEDVEDVCGGKVAVEIVIISPDGKEKTSIKTLDEFKKFEFKGGDPKGKEVKTYTITYTFTDQRFNSKTCEQTVTVVRNVPPIPNCNTTPITLYKDKDCNAKYKLELDEIPTADAIYYHAAKYGDCQNSGFGGGGWGGGAANDCSSMVPVTNKTGFPGGVMKFEDFTILSGSRSGFDTVAVYPDSVRLYDAEGKVLTFSNPLDPKTDRVVTKDVTFRTWTASGQCNCKEDVPYGYATANLSNFKKLPAILDNYNLPVGKNTYVWYFSNTYEKEDMAAKVLVDSCVVTIEVKDTISPKLECGPWEGTTKYYADQSCELSQSQVKVVIPTLTQLNASDNCTATEDLKLSWVRTFKGKKSTDLTVPYKVGETRIDWIVSDESGNSDTCTQYIQVIDTLGPLVDCDLVTPPLTAYVDKNCLAESEVVIKAGLQIPEIDDDPCSPTGAMIKGVGVRDDGKEVMTDAYPKGVTTITWTFTDAAGAFSVCKQTITTLDTIKPVFDCSTILDTTVALDPDSCVLWLDEVLAALGSYTAVDNCDGDIPGKVKLLNKDDVSEIDLPKSFHKDTTYHFIWHFTDKSNNDKTCEQYLTISDTTPPNADDACKLLTDKTITAKDSCELAFENLDINLNSKIYDTCEDSIKAKVQAFVTQWDGEVVRYDDEDIKGVMYPIGTHKFLYIYTDNAGNSDTCIMYRTILDGTKPVILDCFDGKDTVMGNVSSDVCGMTYEDLKDLIILPKSYDECDNLANGGSVVFIDPIVKRYFKNIETDKFELVVDGQDNEEWKEDPFPVGLTKLKFIFIDKAGNEDSCIKYVNVVDARGPSFDCSKIDPNPYYPIADPGECSVKIGDVWDILNGDYVATRSCTDEKIPGVLTLYGTDKKVPSDYVLEVGRDYHLLWVFLSKIDGKKAECDQIIRPNHQNPLTPNCENAADIDTIKATADRCDVPGDSVITKFPYGIDVCSKDTIWGVPHRSDSLEISDPFPTGHTHITWTMVSPYNVEYTAKCEQDINIKGNKHFELNCDELTPAMHRVVDSCGPIVMSDTLTVPFAEDPCANPDSSYYMRPGYGTRSDSTATNPTEVMGKYPLGQTWIEWVFTDFTGSVSDTCNQLVDIRTSLPLSINCDSINKDTISIPVATGECSIPADQVKDSLLNRGYPKAKHPCGLGEFIGIPTRPNGLTMNDPFYVGPNEIIWVFKDSTTHTLVDSVITCTQIVRVGDINEPPVDCSQMPDTLIILDLNDCDIEFSELGLTIKPVYDLCSGAHIDSIVTRASLPGLSSQSGDDVFSVPFTVGVDTVYWKYNFGSYNFLCTQVVTVKDTMEPIVDCDTILDETIILPEGLCEIPKNAVLDSIKQPYAQEYCTGIEIKGVPQLMTISTAGDTTYSELPAKFAVGEPYYISWLFANKDLTVAEERCDIELTIKSSTKPIFDCSVFKDTVKKYLTGVCDVVLDDQILPVPAGKDACVDNYVVYGKGYKIDTVAGNVTYTLLAEMNEGTPSYKVGKLDVGVYNIAWVFESKYSTATDTCVETLNILTDKKMEIACVELAPFAPTSEDSCTTALSLVPPVATNPCTNEVILPDTIIRSDKIPFKGVNDTFYVGRTTVYWIYVDHSKTLKDSIDTCAQIVQVGDVKEEPIKCPKDTLVTLPLGICQLHPDSIHLSDTVPYFRDFCADTIVPLLKVWRASGKPITDPFELGIDTVFRKYFYHGVEYICEQQIKVRNAGIDSFNCKMLGEKDIITVELKTAGNTVPFSEVEKRGFKKADIDKLNACGQLVSEYKRSDNLDLTDPYPLGETTITFTVTDTTPGSVLPKTCTRIVKVVNTAAPELECPKLTDKKYICFKDLPDAYKTLTEFLSVSAPDTAGRVVDLDGNDAIELVDQSTFKMDSVIFDANDDKVTTTNLCEFTLTRTYSAMDVLGQKVTPCSQTFHVKDDVPPVWDAVVASDSVLSSCTLKTPFNNSVVKATDDCWGKTYSNPVLSSSSETQKDGIFFTDWTNKSSDPTMCEYYSYDSVRTFIAVDACNNKSNPIVYKRQVRKTEKPQISIPQEFINSKIFAVPKRPCMYAVPDVDGLLPADVASDYCGDPIAVQNFKHTQKPPKGEIIYTNAGFINVTVVIEDPCGNKDSLTKRVEVPTRESVIKVKLANTLVCAEQGVTIYDSIQYTGQTLVESFFNPGTYELMNTNNVWFDYYKGKLDEDHIYYSNNPHTYSWKYDQVISKKNYLTLNSYSLTDSFYVVAMDTISYCTDTTKAYIEVHEAPTVTLAPELYTICEDDSLHLLTDDETLYDRFKVYTFDNGEAITKEGWMIDSVEYAPNTKIPYSELPLNLQYYATNSCGTHFSNDGVSIVTKAKMSPDHLMLVTNPQNKPRIFMHESAELTLVSNYNPYQYHWYKVNGAYDGRFEEAFDKFGQIKEEYKDQIIDQDSLMEIKYPNEIDCKKYELVGLVDTSSYYVLMLDSVCPAVPSNVVAINVVKEIPTAFTPTNSIGMNDTFMEGYPVIIFNRYGLKMVSSKNGWDGKCRGEYVDPGVYYYEIVLKDNTKHKGTIEVVYFK